MTVKEFFLKDTQGHRQQEGRKQNKNIGSWKADGLMITDLAEPGKLNPKPAVGGKKKASELHYRTLK